ncbi:MAG: hypothetical protein KIT84_28470 [Labilithrix sp.]|nr:hypothetical protein [Labilithrix sp.]MCW5814994.1 hypothetical protein [Labilithrix sp.]
MSRLGLALLLVGAVGALACQTDEVEKPTYEFGLFPKIAHSGFNATTRFNVVYATSAPAPEWSIDDPSIGTIAPTVPPSIPGVDVSNLKFALVTTTKAGETTVHVRSGDTVLDAQLVVKGYTDEQVVLGKARYDTDATNGAEPARKPCADCHTKPEGVDHSPLKMAGFDDPTILGVIQDATYPDGGAGSSTTSAFRPSGPLTLTTHKWGLTEPEKDGILAYLRSLPLGKVTDAGAPPPDGGP